MSKEYKNKLAERGLDVKRLPVAPLWTTADGRFVTPVIFDKTIFAEIGEAGTVAGVVDVMNRRIAEKYGLLQEEFEVASYMGDGMHNRLIATVYVEPGCVGNVMMQVESWKH